MAEITPAYAQEKSTELLGEQLSQLIRPLFKNFEENPFTKGSPYASFTTYLLANTLGKELARDGCFDPIVQGMSDSLLKVQEKGKIYENPL